MYLSEEPYLLFNIHSSMKNTCLTAALGLFVLASCESKTTLQTQSETHPAKDSLLLVMNITKKVKPEFVTAFRESFEKCKVGTLLEPGCIDYGMYQSYGDSTIFFIAETWKNKSEHRKHMDTPHLQVHLQEVKEMVDPEFVVKKDEIYVCPAVNE